MTETAVEEQVSKSRGLPARPPWLVQQLCPEAAPLPGRLPPHHPRPAGQASNHTSPKQVGHLVAKSSYGDTVLLQLIAANCDAAQFAALVRHLVMEQRQEVASVQDYPAMAAGQKNRLGDDFFGRQVNFTKLY